MELNKSAPAWNRGSKGKTLTTQQNITQAGSFAKISIDGLNGSGKTWTAALASSGLAKDYEESRPVVVYDSSDRWRFVDHHIFKAEGVPLIRIVGRSMVKVREAVQRAREENAAVFVADDLTIPWKELLESFGFEDGRLPIERQQQVQREWNDFVVEFLHGQFHGIGCGRLGYNWQRVENDSGYMELTQGDSKFNAGGGNNFGYECDLELELRRSKRMVKSIFRGKLQIDHICDVVKDATSILNGKQFIFSDFEHGYKPGNYKIVLNSIRPHVEFLRETSGRTVDHSSSKELLVTGKTPWKQDQDERTALLEEISAHLELCFGSGQSKEGKMFRNLTLNRWHGYMSWSRLENEATTGQLQMDLGVLKRMYARICDGQMPTDKNSLESLITISIDDHLHPNRENVTLLEELGRKSLERVRKPALAQAGD